MCTDMPPRPNTTQPLRIVIDAPALAHTPGRLRHALGWRPPRERAVAKANASGHGGTNPLTALAAADELLTALDRRLAAQLR